MSANEEPPMSSHANSLGRSMREHGLRLAAFAFGTALLIALVYTQTRARIADQRLNAERAALAEVLPAALHDNDLVATRFMLGPNSDGYVELANLGLSTERSAYRASRGREPTGVILPLETALGYSGTIVLLVGISSEGAITGVRVVQHAETPGLGDKIDAALSPWITSFDNRSLANTPVPLWRVKKDGGDFDQFVGATITPRAVVAAVQGALLFFEANRTTLLQTPTIDASDSP